MALTLTTMLISTSEIGLWLATKAISGVYYGGKYLIWGRQKSETEKLTEQITKLERQVKTLTNIVQENDTTQYVGEYIYVESKDDHNSPG